MTIINLPDGRHVDMDVSGPEDGIPLVFHHGIPGSVRQFRGMPRAAHERGLRLVTFSPPGYGDSTRQPGHRVVDAAADVEAEAVGLRDADAAGLIAGLATLLPDVDRAVLTDEFGEDMAAGFAEAFRTGVDGWVDDDLAFVAPWGFELAEIEVPTFVWQGSEDLMVPFAHGRWLAAQVPGATAHLLQGEGHLSVGVGAVDQMFDELLTTLSD